MSLAWIYVSSTFVSRARLGSGKNANFRLPCSTKTKVENQAPNEQNA